VYSLFFLLFCHSCLFVECFRMMPERLQIPHKDSSISPTSSSATPSPSSSSLQLSADAINSSYGDDETENTSLHPFQKIFDNMQRLNNVQEVLQSPYSHPLVIRAIRHMNQVKLEDLGIDGSYVQSLTAGQCMTVLESRRFDIAAFLLPAGFKLHLHDHPNMVVCSKLLHGSASIKSFSRVKKRKNGDVDARLEVDMQKSVTDEPWLLTPRHGNYHEITPLTECVMLDILLPPYDDEQRPCHFYHAVKKNVDESSESNYLLKRLTYEEQLQIELPYPVTYIGYRPS
jgi:hypothetical protein